MRDLTAEAWSAEEYAAHAAFVATLGKPLLSLLNLKPGMKVLDLGCGDGTLSREISQSGADVVAIDLSPDMVAHAKASGVDARIGDGQHLHFHNEFDAVFSNAALHWMTENPQAAVDGVYRALKPGGRFVAEMGGRGNITHIIEAFKEVLHHAGLEAEIENVWYFPSEADYRARLERAGFTIETISMFNRPTPLATGIEPWVRMFGRPLLQRLPTASRKAAITQIANALEPHLKAKDGSWVADYVRLRFAAVKPA